MNKVYKSVTSFLLVVNFRVVSLKSTYKKANKQYVIIFLFMLITILLLFANIIIIHTALK